MRCAGRQQDGPRRSREERSKPVVYRPAAAGLAAWARARRRARHAGTGEAARARAGHVAWTQSATPSLFWHLDGVAETARIVSP
jgi:hypothetical protein